MKKSLLSLVFSTATICLFAQQADNSLLKGQILGNNNEPLVEAEVVLKEQKSLAITDNQGRFQFSNLKNRNYTLIISQNAFQDSVTVAVDKELVDLGTIKVSFNNSSWGMAPQQNVGMPTITLEESSASPDDENMSSQSISGILSASRDPYLSAASYTFGSLRYQIRGYKRNHLEVYMNGLLMNDLASGSAFFGQWGGLNDAFRNQSTTFGLNAADEGFGGLIGLTAIDATANSQRAQTRISYARANATYRNRLMITHSTGMMKNGWALSASVSRRWANEGYIPGTSYDGYSYYLGLSKKLNAKNMLHFTTFGAPTKRGKAMPAIQEAMDLMGSHYYNPNWGYLNGEKRNARINNTFQPVFMLNYEWKPNALTFINFAAAYQNGYNGNSALDWYNAQDPRPDYYRNLPSYYLLNPAGANEAAAEMIRKEWEENPEIGQINWNRLYETNRLNTETVNGVTGLRSLYVIGEDRDDVNKYNFAATGQRIINEHVSLQFGANYIHQRTESYRKMLDLLGGDFYVNLNQFAERTYIGNDEFNQNDLNNPNQIIKEGDRYQYNYIARYHKAFTWGQSMFTYDKIDFFASARFGFESFSREGLYKNGLFQQDSYGKSDQKKFFTYDLKAGATYKLDGRNYLFANGAFLTEAPSFDNTFFSPRTRNAAVTNPQLEKISSMEFGYLLNAPRLRGRLSGFVTESRDATRVLRYYNESFRTFVNYVMQGVDTRNLGMEFALQGKISPSLSATLVAAWTQAFYTSRPDIDIYRDNDTTSTIAGNTVYWKNYYVASGPQSAYTLGINYNSPKYWFANINFNYLNRNYLDVNPSRLTEEAVGLTPPNSPEWHRILDQEQLPGMFTIDLFVGKSFALNKLIKSIPRGTMLFVNLGVNNLLNNKNNITGGFQQLRFDMASRNPERFPSKYFYGFGTTYFLNVSLKF